MIGSIRLQRPLVGARALCGIERWDVKTLTDPAARRLILRLRLSSV